MRRVLHRHFKLTASTFVLALAAVPAASGQAALNEWDVMSALRDIVQRSLALEFIKVDPYQLVDAVRRDIDLYAPLCSLRSVKEGLVSGTCNPVTMKKCGARCVELSIDAGVHARAANRIDADLRTACRWLPALQLGHGRRDSRPSFFYLSRNRAIESLGCTRTPIEIESSTFKAGTLTVRYRIRAMS